MTFTVGVTMLPMIEFIKTLPTSTYVGRHDLKTANVVLFPNLAFCTNAQETIQIIHDTNINLRLATRCKHEAAMLTLRTTG